MLQKVLEVSQTQTLLTYVIQKRNILRALGTSFGAREGAALDKLVEGVFLAEPMFAAAKAHFIAHWDFALASRAARLFGEQPHARLLALEAATGSPAEKGGLQTYWADPDDSASGDRVDLIAEIDALVLATDWMCAFMEVLVSSLTDPLAEKVRAGRLSQANYDGIFPALRQQAQEIREAQPGVLLLVYAYRHVPTADLEEYLGALRSPEGRWLLQTSRGALMAALRPELEQFAVNTAELF